MSCDSSFQVFDRTVAILDSFTLEQPRWTLGRLVEQLAMPRSTVHRYVHYLAQYALLERLEDGSYALGPKTALGWHHAKDQRSGQAFPLQPAEDERLVPHRDLGCVRKGFDEFDIYRRAY